MGFPRSEQASAWPEGGSSAAQPCLLLLLALQSLGLVHYNSAALAGF